MLNSEPTIRIGRRDFTARGILLLLSGVTVTIAAACGGSSSPAAPSPSPTPTPAATDVTASSISNNHGHIATISAAMITAANSVTLNIQGNATHNHTIALSATEVAQAAAKQKVAKDSSTDNGHNHTVTFN